MRVAVGHFEIPARDPERAARFYREALGWRVEPLGWDGPTYFQLEPGAPALAAGAPVRGGLTAPEVIGSPQPLLVLQVWEGTVADVLDRVLRAGGEVDLPPRPVGGFGTFARFRDPEGNLLGLWSPPVSASSEPPFSP